MKHIERMETEIIELEQKIFLGSAFLEKESGVPNLTNEKQRRLLEVQLHYMQNYFDILLERIEYEKKLCGIS